MRYNYSFKKSVAKGVSTLLMAVITIVTIAGVGDVTLHQLYTDYLKETFTGLSLIGLLRIAQNYVKYNWLV